MGENRREVKTLETAAPGTNGAGGVATRTPAGDLSPGARRPVPDSPDEQRGLIYDELTRITAEKKETFKRRNRESLTGVKRWKVLSLVGTMFSMMVWALIAWRQPSLARTDWYLLIFLVQTVAALVLILISAIRREELRRETPAETLGSIKADADADRSLTRALQEMVRWPSFAGVYADVKTDVELFETRIKRVSDILNSIGPLPAAIVIAIKVFGDPPDFIAILTNGVLVIAVMATLMKLFLDMASQPYVVRRRQCLTVLDRAKAYADEAGEAAVT